MNLRVKTLTLVIAALLVSAATLFYVASSITRDSYSALEQQSANQDIARLKSVFLADLKRMFGLLEDYASWDDTYEFAVTRSPEYVSSNLSGDTFSNLGINVLIMVDRQGRELHSSTHSLKDPLAGKTVKHLLNALLPGGDLFEENPWEYGLVALDKNVLLIAMAPILRSDDSGEARGVALVGRYLDDKKLREFRRNTQLDISFETVQEANANNAAVMAEFQKLTAIKSLTLAAPPSLLKSQDDNILKGHLLMPDVLGKPLLLWSVTIPRNIHLQGKKSLRFLLIAMGIVSLIVIVSVVLLLEWLVLRRVARLRGEVAAIGAADNLAARVNPQGNDELSFLAHSVNGMLEQLQVSKDKLEAEHERAENLLLNILPVSVAEQLKDSQGQIADAHQEVTVLFADLVGFTSMSAEMEAADLVSMLNDIFSEFDELAEEFGLEKIKTIGDAYMVASGLPEVREDHAEAIADMALRMITTIEDYAERTKTQLNIRIGINTGHVVAGVIGKKKFVYDLWGDTVNIASRMESSSGAGMIQVTEATREKIKHAFNLKKRGVVKIKGRGEMVTYILTGRKANLQ